MSCDGRAALLGKTQGRVTSAGRSGPPPPRMDLPSPWVLALSPFPCCHARGKQTPAEFLFYLFIYLLLTPETFYIGVELINSVGIVSGEQGRNSAIQASILSQTFLPSRLAHNIAAGFFGFYLIHFWLHWVFVPSSQSYGFSRSHAWM